MAGFGVGFGLFGPEQQGFPRSRKNFSGDWSGFWNFRKGRQVLSQNSILKNHQKPVPQNLRIKCIGLHSLGALILAKCL